MRLQLIYTTSSSHRLESVGLNALEGSCLDVGGNREDGNACLVLKARQKIGVAFDSH